MKQELLPGALYSVMSKPAAIDADVYQSQRPYSCEGHRDPSKQTQQQQLLLRLAKICPPAEDHERASVVTNRSTRLIQAPESHVAQLERLDKLASSCERLDGSFPSLSSCATRNTVICYARSAVLCVASRAP